MAKTMCKLTKDLPDNLDKIIEVVSKPENVCKKCGRVANKESLLCKPHKL
jgi:hypothetical protein